MKKYFQDIISTIKTLVTGMSVTIDHMRNKEQNVATLQYPREKWPQPEKNIGFELSEYNVIRSRLHVDIDDCIGCLQCERACPVDCIKIDTVKPPKDSDFDCGSTSNETQKKMLVSRFSIDMSECMYCNLCVYPCPEECIYMVGGPNEEKHDIDYEFSQYERKGMIFEFANITDEEVIKAGGQLYLDKRSEVEKSREDGKNLMGIEEVIEEAVKSDASSESSVSEAKEDESGLSIKIFNNVPDKMARGIAKKAFTGAKRNKKDLNEMAEDVSKAIDAYNKMSDEMSEAINLIKNYKEPELSSDESDSSKLESSQNKGAGKLEEQETNAPEGSSDSKPEVNLSQKLFDIKKLNNIEDKMVRGTTKKIFLGCKKENKSSVETIDAIKEELKAKNLLNDDIEVFLQSLAPRDSSLDGAIESLENQENVQSSADLSQELFDIKKLNNIEDKMVRGTAKKIYLGCKKANKSSIDTIDAIKEELKVKNLFNDDIDRFLKEICN